MKRLNEICFTLGEPEQWKDMTIHHAIAQYLFRDVDDAIGVDPGKNWGISVLSGGILFVYWGKLPKMEYPDYPEYLANFVSGWFSPNFTATMATIEGAAYGAIYGRESLEDIRVGLYIAFKELGKEVLYIPPLKIRRGVFGDGKIKASDIWLSINPNGADSAAIALYTGGYRFDSFSKMWYN